MITLKIECSTCGKTLHAKGDRMFADNVKDFNVEALTRRVEKHGWIVQINGQNIDTYCSKACS